MLRCAMIADAATLLADVRQTMRLFAYDIILMLDAFLRANSTIERYVIDEDDTLQLIRRCCCCAMRHTMPAVRRCRRVIIDAA